MIKSIVRRASLKDTDQLNIISWSTHEAYQSNLLNTNAHYYNFDGGGFKDWKEVYRPLPANHTLIRYQGGDLYNYLPKGIDFDLVFGHNRYAHYEQAKGLAARLNVPLVFLEHCLPMPTNPDIVPQLKKMQGDTNVFISEFSREVWDYKENEAKVVHHGINTEVFSPLDSIKREKYSLSICNDWVNRDQPCGFNLWRSIVQNDIPIRILGDTPGLSQPAKDLDELVAAYRSCGVFLNTSLVSPVPSVLLEAMSVGCAVVSTATCMIPEIITNGVNGIISNDPAVLRKVVKDLLENPTEARRLGHAARQTILDKFSAERFVKNWDNLFRLAIEEFGRSH